MQKRITSDASGKKTRDASRNKSAKCHFTQFGLNAGFHGRKSSDLYSYRSRIGEST